MKPVSRRPSHKNVQYPPPPHLGHTFNFIERTSFGKASLSRNLGWFTFKVGLRSWWRLGGQQWNVGRLIIGPVKTTGIVSQMAIHLFFFKDDMSISINQTVFKLANETSSFLYYSQAVKNKQDTDIFIFLTFSFIFRLDSSQLCHIFTSEMLQIENSTILRCTQHTTMLFYIPRKTYFCELNWK